MRITKNTKIFLLGLTILVMLLVSYSNHFNNGFHFDDSHVIVSNGAIRNIGDIASFFTDPTTFSSLPANQAYRPMVTLMNAIDYWTAGNELNPFYFHLHVFFWYIVQIILMFFLFRNIFNKSIDHKWSDYIALFAVGWYALHTANAETINYISARSDSFSTLCIVATLFLFQYNKTRKSLIYLIPLVLGVFTKQTTVMLYPILFLYVFFFEVKNQDLVNGLTTALRRSAPAGIIVIGLFLFNQLYITPDSTVSSNVSVTKWQYFSTQWFIIAHYLKNFFIPISLSADPDFVVMKEFLNLKKILGLFLILSMLLVAYRFYRYEIARPISFGVLWFFIALLPTSSFVPLYQVANDHRTFLPYIGLVLAVSYGIGLVLLSKESYLSQSMYRKSILFCAVLIVFSGYAFGTYQRNEIWGNSELLWHDVTVKSPKNSRGLMNYGNALMAKGEYEEALSYFNKTLAIAPEYSYAHVNMGVLLGAMGKIEEAEEYFENGILYGSNNPEAYYYYGRWLFKEKRFAEARKILDKAIVISPTHTKVKMLLDQVEILAEKDARSGLLVALKNAEDNPNYENYLNISLAQYKVKNWEECIAAARKALEIKPDAPGAYNNICTAMIQLGRYDEAIENCNKAIELLPDYELAKNNLNWALQSKKAQ